MAGLAGAAVVCSLFASSNGLVVAIALSIVVAIGVTWPWIAMTGIRGTFAFDKTRGREGHRSGLRIALVNRAPWPVWALGVDFGCTRTTGLPTSAIGQPARPADAVVPVIAPFGRVEIASEVHPDCRGDLPMTPPMVRCGFPFGLWHVARRLNVTRSTLAWPGRLPTKELSDRGERPFFGEQLQQKIGTAGEMIGVREYRRGDPLNRFHWKQTAKHGRLIVCELQSQATPWIQIVLDVDPAVHVGSAPTGTRRRRSTA